MPEMTWREAIDHILASSETPLHYKEITERIITEKLRENLGAKPADHVRNNIAISFRHEGEKSPYLRIEKGVYTLRAGSSVHQADIAQDETEEQYEIVTSFGMFWRREAVEWIGTPKLLGMQQIGATPVDFCKQLGIYLLYDGREVIYVGRSTERPLGRRLYEHTIDRLSARWDRFSWFGLLPVSDEGEIGALPGSYIATDLIPALEAILIEALEPRQNRKRGDDLAAVEYLQKLDPAIEKKKMRATLDTVLNKL